MRAMFEILLLAFTLFGEGSGERVAGKIGVGSVIRNRVNHEIFPNTYIDVLLQDKQFSCWNGNEVFKHVGRSVGILYKKYDKRAFKHCLWISGEIYNNRLKDNTNGALWYVREDIVRSWMSDLTILITMGKHKFMGEG